MDSGSCTTFMATTRSPVRLVCSACTRLLSGAAGASPSIGCAVDCIGAELHGANVMVAPKSEVSVSVPIFARDFPNLG